MGKAVGIDLGTTNSCVAVFGGAGEPQVLPGPDGSRTMPSVVAFTDAGDRLVGQAARRQAIANPTYTISSVKRLMGRRAEEISDEDKDAFTTLKLENGHVRLECRGTDTSPEQLSAFILAKLRANAEEFLGEDVTDAVITVPAYFNDAQRQATKDAGRIAGLNVLRIINEPTAAALAYGLDKTDQDQTILVFDLGGGTFDVSVLELGDGVFDVRATAGDNHLGGDDFDRVIVEWLMGEIKDAHDVDLSRDTQAHQRLYEAAEKAKRELSGGPTADIQLPFLSTGKDGQPIHFAGDLTRSQFERLSASLLERLEEPIRQVMSDSGLGEGQIDHLILVGGMSRMPAVQEMVRTMTGLEPTRSVNPDEVVALGAAVQAEVLTGDSKGVLLLDVTPLSLGIETRGGLFNRLIERNSTIPCKKTQVFTTAEDEQASVEVHVLQGEREMASDNRTLGRLQLLGIPAASRGVPQVEVSFELDANGILSVRAIDLGTGNEQQARMENGTGLDEQTLQRLILEAREHASADARTRKMAELRNRADGLLYSAEETAAKMGDRLSPELSNRFLDAIATLRAALHGGGAIETLEAAIAEIVAASYEVADVVYRQGAPSLDFGAPSVSDAVVIDLEGEEVIEEPQSEGPAEEEFVVSPADFPDLAGSEPGGDDWTAELAEDAPSR